MLKLFYLFLKKYIPDQHFELLESDTDSIYFSIGKEKLDDCVSLHLKGNYFQDKLMWLTFKACPEQEEAFIQCKIQGKEWDMHPCCSTFETFDKRWRWNTKETNKTIFEIVFLLKKTNK